MIATRNNRGVAHENGAIEGPHRHWKHRLEQQLIQRGSRDFATEAEYRQVVVMVSASLNNRAEVEGKLAIERLHLQPLPVERFADYEPVVTRVRSTSTIEVRSVTYSVPSRLIGQQLTVHLRHDRMDLFLRSQFVETLPRLHARKGQKALRRIDFRHVIESLRRKPRALLRAQLQADILPGENWRQLWRKLLRPCRRMRPPRSWSRPSRSPPAQATWPAWSGICGVSYATATSASAPCVITTACGPHGARWPCLHFRSLNTPSAAMTNSWAEPPRRPTLETALPTLLKQLKLAQFRSQWQAAEQQASAEGWDPASYLYVLAEQEHQQRHQARLRRLLH